MLDRLRWNSRTGIPDHHNELPTSTLKFQLGRPPIFHGVVYQVGKGTFQGKWTSAKDNPLRAPIANTGTGSL